METINEYTFSGCTQLKHVGLSRNIKAIKEYAFQDCQNLENFIIWSTVGEIGNRAFGSWRSYQIISIESQKVPQGWDKDWNNTDAKIVFVYAEE